MPGRYSVQGPAAGRRIVLGLHLQNPVAGVQANGASLSPQRRIRCACSCGVESQSCRRCACSFIQGSEGKVEPHGAASKMHRTTLATFLGCLSSYTFCPCLSLGMVTAALGCFQSNPSAPLTGHQRPTLCVRLSLSHTHTHTRPSPTQLRSPTHPNTPLRVGCSSHQPWHARR